EGRPRARLPRRSEDRRHPGAHRPGPARRDRQDRGRRGLPHRPPHRQRRLGRGDGAGAALRHRARERRLGARGGRGRHQRRRRRHGDPAPAALLRVVPGLPAGPRHAVRGRVLPRPVRQRRRHGRVPAHHRPGVHQARPEHEPGRRRCAGRRRHHRLPRGAQGGARPLPRDHGGRAGRRRPRPHRDPDPRGDHRHAHRRGRPQPRRAGAGQADRRGRDRPLRRHARRCGQGPHRWAGRRRRLRLRRRAGRRTGRLADDRAGRVALRPRLRRRVPGPDAGLRRRREERDRQHRRYLRRPLRTDGPGAGREGHAAHQAVPARRRTRRSPRSRRRPGPRPRDPGSL
ncbi:MAG: Alcohol dehydrogenase (Zn-containing), partial [uncultured Pseudonocardia sp.]